MCIYAYMESDLNLRLKVDRLLIEYLCAATGKTASALAIAAGMAPTTLNRFLSRTIKLKSVLKDQTIDRVARKWGFDHLELLAYRRKIEDALRAGKPVPSLGKIQRLHDAGRDNDTQTPPRDPLLDQVMNATYQAWFQGYQARLRFDRLPDLVHVLYGRVRQARKSPSVTEIQKRAADVLAVAAMQKRK